MSTKEHKIECALVTGASSGIGEALCRLLATKGIEIIATGRNIEKLNELSEELHAHAKISVIQADLSLPEDRRRVVSIIKERVPDLVINNAGLGSYGDALIHTTESQMEIVEVNVMACMQLSLEAGRAMAEAKKEGTILNVSSVVGCLDYFPGFTVYTASKKFVNAFSLALHEEMDKHGIDVLTACPGQVDTEFRSRASEGAIGKEPNGMTPEFAAKEILEQVYKRKRLHIFNWKYRFAVGLITLMVPKRWIYQFLYSSIIGQRK